MYLFCDSFTAEFEQGSYRDCLSTPLAISAAGAHSPPRQPARRGRQGNLLGGSRPHLVLNVVRQPLNQFSPPDLKDRNRIRYAPVGIGLQLIGQLNQFCGVRCHFFLALHIQQFKRLKAVLQLHRIYHEPVGVRRWIRHAVHRRHARLRGRIGQSVSNLRLGESRGERYRRDDSQAHEAPYPSRFLKYDAPRSERTDAKVATSHADSIAGIRCFSSINFDRLGALSGKNRSSDQIGKKHILRSDLAR